MSAVSADEVVPDAEIALKVDSLSTWFPTPRGLLRAVDDVSLVLRSGSTLGVVGESGSGKSMLARSVMDLLPAKAIRPAGTVMFEGRDLRTITRQEGRKIWGSKISMVFQDPMTALNPTVRVGRQITESLRTHSDIDRGAAAERAVELLARVGIPEPATRIEAFPHELSGGMRQRVCIAIALACSPKLLIADEPTTALDVTIQRQILDLLSSLQRESHMSMMLITHDLGVVAARTNYIAVMYAGRIVEQASTPVLFREMRHPYTQALLGSIPRIEEASGTRLAVIPGRPPVPTEARTGCSFAPRCRYAQPRCLVEDPDLTPVSPGHSHACFFPVGTPEGADALAANLAAGRTAAGLVVTDRAVA